MKKHKCALFRESGKLRVGEAAIQINDAPAVEFSINKRSWTCVECEQQMWLEASIDPNPAGVKMTEKAKRS